MKRYRGVILGGIALVPLVMLALWAASGRERLSKPQKSVRIEVRDELFGDVTERDTLVRGPIFGYFVGLDAVGISAAGAALIAGATLWLTRPPRTAGNK